jgi:hypothetical protein
VNPARAALLAVLCLADPTGGAQAQTWRTITSARQVHGETELTVEVDYAAGRFRLSPGAGGSLYRMEMRYDEERFTPVREYDAGAGILRLGVRSRRGEHVRVGTRRRSSEIPSLDVTLTPEVPLTLNLDLGATQADVELGGLALRSLQYRTGASESRMRFSRPNPVDCEELELRAGAAELEVSQIANANCGRIRFHGGVGEVTLDFTGTWRRSMEADINVGIGSLTLELPTDVGVSVRVTRFLASFESAGLIKRGNTYYSRNYEVARQRLTMTVNATIGEIGVNWAGER